MKHPSIRQLAMASGLSAYKIQKALDTGAMSAPTAEEATRYARQQIDLPARVSQWEAAFFLGSQEALEEWQQQGALLPDVDGMYHASDLKNLMPRRFALLPPHPDYTPRRPQAVKPMRWKPHTAERKAQFERAYQNKLTYCPWLTRDAYGFYPPDGCYAGAYPREGAQVQMLRHQALRYHLVGFSTKRYTVVQMRLSDSLGGTIYTHGVFHRPDAWTAAASRALEALGFNPAPSFESVADALNFLDKWLNIS